MKPLEGRVALVTGAGRGSGRGIALCLARDGATVAINYRRDEEAARSAVAEIEAAGGKAKAYRASVDDLEQDRAMVEQVLADFGPVDILVNNAGIASRGNLVIDTDPAEMERVVRAHAFGAFYVTQLVLPGMRTRPRGDIVMISSTTTDTFPSHGSPYAMAKGALEALAWTLAKEELAHGIRVNIVAPGLIESDMGSRLMKASRGVQDIKDLYAEMPFNHICQPEDIGNLVAFLASERGSFINATRIRLNGGHDVDHTPQP